MRATGRSAQGVTLVNVKDGDQIAAACAVPKSQKEGADVNGYVYNYGLTRPVGEHRNEIQVPRRANGQKFRDSLYKGQHYYM